MIKSCLKNTVTEDPCMHCDHLKLLVRLKGAVPLLSSGILLMIFFREIEYYILVKRKKEKQIFFSKGFFSIALGWNASTHWRQAIQYS